VEERKPIFMFYSFSYEPVIVSLFCIAETIHKKTLPL